MERDRSKPFLRPHQHQHSARNILSLGAYANANAISTIANSDSSINVNASENQVGYSSAAAILALPPRTPQGQHDFGLLSIEDIDFDDEFVNEIPEYRHFPDPEHDSSISESESSHHHFHHLPSTRIDMMTNTGTTRSRSRSPNHQQIIISRSRRRRRDQIQIQNTSINNSRNFRSVPMPPATTSTTTPVNVISLTLPTNQNQRQRPFRVSNAIENDTGRGGENRQGQGQGEQRQGQQQGQGNEEINNDSFTLFEHIGMIGARNFFIPSPHRASTQCVACYKRAAFYLGMVLTISCLFFFWNSLLNPYHMIGRQFFTAERFQQMFITDRDFYPLSAMLVIYLTMILSGWAVHYTNKPEYDNGFLTYLTSVRCLLAFGAGILCWHIYAHAKYYPDDEYSAQLETVMTNSIKIARGNLLTGIKLRKPVPAENKIWDDTQHVFKCCGIHDFRDWIPENRTELQVHLNLEKHVPRSCCGDSTADVCDPHYVYKNGCLNAQMKGLLTESIWVINPGLFMAVFVHLAFYIVLGKLFSNTVARNRTGRPFDPPPAPIDANANAHPQIPAPI